MPKSLRWIIVLAMGWEPVEDKKADFVYEILEINKPNINVEGFSYIPEQYIKETNAESLAELLNAEGVLASCVGAPYLQPDGIISYIGVEMAPLFEFQNYEILYDSYKIDNMEGFIVWLYDQETSPMQSRKMVQQIKQSADRPGLPKMSKPHGSIPSKKIVTFGKTPSGPLTPIDYPESRFKKTRTRLPAYPPTVENKDYAVPEEPTQPRLSLPGKIPQPEAPGLSPKTSEWESFLEDLDSELTDADHEPSSAGPLKTIKREAPPPLPHKPDQMEKTRKIAGPKRTKAVPEMYMNIQQKNKQDRGKSEFSEWNDFLGGLDAEVSQDPDSQPPATPGNIPMYRPENIIAEKSEEETHSKTHKGRGLIPSTEDMSVESAFKQYGQRARGEQQKKTPSSKTPTPMMPDIAAKKTVTRRPEQIPKLTPTVQRKTPPAVFGHNKPGTPTPIFGPGGRPIAPQTPPPMVSSPIGTGHMSQTPAPIVGHVPQTPTPMVSSAAGHVPPPGSPPPSPIVTPAPGYKKHVTPPPVSSKEHGDSGHAQKKRPTRKTRKKRKSFLTRVAGFLVVLILLTGGGGYAWYLNGGKPFIDPYLSRSRQIWLQVREKITGEKGPEAKKLANFNKEYQQITEKLRQEPTAIASIQELDKFIAKLPASPLFLSLAEAAKQQRQQALENLRITIKKNISKSLHQNEFVQALQMVNNAKIFSELGSFCTLQQKAIENFAENTLDKSLKYARTKVRSGDFVAAIAAVDSANKNQLPELKKQLEKQKGRLLHSFVEVCQKSKRYLPGIKYLYRFLLEQRQADHDVLQTQNYIIWLIHHHMLTYTREHNYELGHSTIEKYQRIKLNKISSQVKQFLSEIEAEKQLWEWLWQGTARLARERRVLRFELHNDVNAFQARIINYRSPKIELWTSQKRFVLKIDSLNWNCLEEICKYAKINISEQDLAYRLGLFLFSQKRIEEARPQFIKAGKIMLFKDKLKYYE